jgi:hypothetical protein
MCITESSWQTVFTALYAETPPASAAGGWALPLGLRCNTGERRRRLPLPLAPNCGRFALWSRQLCCGDCAASAIWGLQTCSGGSGESADGLSKSNPVAGAEALSATAVAPLATASPALQPAATESLGGGGGTLGTAPAAAHAAGPGVAISTSCCGGSSVSLPLFGSIAAFTCTCTGGDAATRCSSFAAQHADWPPAGSASWHSRRTLHAAGGKSRMLHDLQGQEHNRRCVHTAGAHDHAELEHHQQLQDK